MSFLEGRLLIPFKRYFDDTRMPLKAYADSAGHDLYVNETVRMRARGRVYFHIFFTKVFLWTNSRSFWSYKYAGYCCI